MGKLRRRWLDAALCAAFLLVSTLVARRLGSAMDVDSFRYLEIAKNVAAGKGFSFTDLAGRLMPDFSRTPLFPALIALALKLTGSEVAAVGLVLWVQRLAWAGAVALALPACVSAADRVRRWAVVGKVVLLFSPVVLYHSALLLTDLLYAAGVLWLLRLSLLALGSGRRCGLAGFAQGALTLLRPMHLWAATILAAPWIRGRPRAALVVFVGCSLVLPGMWMARNAYWGSPGVLSAVSGRSLALHREAVMREMATSAEGDLPGEEGKFLQALVRTEESAYTAAWICMKEDGLTEPEADRLAGAVAVHAIIWRPGDYVVTSLRNVWRFLWSPIEGQLLYRALAGDKAMWQAGLINGVWGLVFFAVVPAYILLRGRPRLIFSRVGRALFLYAAYACGVAALTTVTYGRFFLPVLPVLGFVYCYGRAGASAGKNSSA